MADVRLIADGAQLARVVYATTVTVLLLSSPYSSETPSALTALSQAADLISCPSVQYVQFSLHPGSVVHPPRRWFPFVDPTDAVLNLTSVPRFFPCVRLFHIEKRPFVREFRSALDPVLLAAFVSSACGVEVRFPHVLSRDEFGAGVRAGARGVLLIANSPHARFNTDWLPLAHAVANAVARRSRWVFSVVDSQKDVLFARRVANNSLLFVSLSEDKAVLYDVARFPALDVFAVMARFERLPSRTGVRHGRLARSMPLAFFDGVSAARRLLDFATSWVSLSSLLDADYSHAERRPSVLWVVVMQTWCAYCQRLLPVYEHLSKISSMARVDVDVLFVEHVDALPPAFDRLVDGFPTVLRVEQFGGVRELTEYVGLHSTEALIDEHCEEQGAALSAALGALHVVSWA
ncbi:unnamed protein product [Agarophyton chilense]|eukprot:gb/GEZJ01002359.1/.p1 GENE.gb/GEZJ01002359.1/~~gb/GEZJ01002359.1/.p1  ORF type:complete len:405 (+),score=43.56 gb/GEZJ01002359.1/:1202-2416(+)